MENESKDVKPGENSSSSAALWTTTGPDALSESTLQTDVKSREAIDSHVTNMIDALIEKKSVASTEEDEVGEDDEKEEKGEEKEVDTNTEEETKEEKGDSKSRSKKEQDDDEEDEEKSDEKEEESKEQENEDDENEESDEDENEEESDTEADDKGDKKGEEDSKHETSVPYKRFEKVNRQLRDLTPLAQAHQRNIDFCQKNRITPQQYKIAMEVQGLINTDPGKALEHLERVVDHLKVASGRGLPGDLQSELNEAAKEVTEGTMSKTRFESLEKRLKETAQLRLKEQQLQSRSESSEEAQALAYQREVTQTFSTWARSKERLNPSFKTGTALHESFMDKLYRLNAERQPATLDAMLGIAEEAYRLAKKGQGGGDANGKDKLNGNGTNGNGKHRIEKKVLRSDRSTSGRVEREKPARSVDDVMNNIAKKHGFR